jgi:hypothetical protein
MFDYAKMVIRAWFKMLRNADLYEVMRYEVRGENTALDLPTVYAFRAKPHIPSFDPRPSFVFLETQDEIDDWHKAMSEKVERDFNGHISDSALLHWNNVPSLLTADNEIIATYFPMQEGGGWPSLALQAHPFDAVLDDKPARDRYYFQQNKIIGFL